jgi:hypothetical protein
MSPPDFDNIHVKQLDDGWLEIFDGDEKLATAWCLRSVATFINNYKKNKMKKFYTDLIAKLDG